jgi:ABC-type transporter Mla maintaining outer membrane lipid asymmetry ATPase subunit MlaF
VISSCRLKVRAISTKAKVVELSGGNQQKVAIAKSLAQEPTIAPTSTPRVGSGKHDPALQSLIDEAIEVLGSNPLSDTAFQVSHHSPSASLVN